MVYAHAFWASSHSNAAGAAMKVLLEFAFRFAVKRGTLKVIRAGGEVLTFGDGTGKPVTIRYADARAEVECVLNPELKFGELYTDGRIVVEEGSLYDFLFLLLQDMRTTDTPWPFSWLEQAELARERRKPANEAKASRHNVKSHYDLGDALYALFLDPDWQYSCAYYENDQQTLDEAQLNKKRHLAAKLRLTPETSVLDIGCGWGGLALYLAGIAGVRHVTGVTLSTEQINRARARSEAAGLTDRVTFNFQDYRAIEGTFDRIVSVGMFEHVGLGYYDTFFKVCADRLAPDGVMLLHTIGLTGTPGLTNAWIKKYIFPGGHLPSLSDIVTSVEKSGLILTDVESLGPHYARTLRAWRMNFYANRAEVLKLYDERFCRMWDFYLCMAEIAFATNDISLFQVQIAKDRNQIPLTRDYMHETEARLRPLENPVPRP